MPIVLPNECPVCHHIEYSVHEDEVVARCQNMECPAQIKGTY